MSHLLFELFVRLTAADLTDGMSFHLPLTQELIGDALGLTTIHVNRSLRLLRETAEIDGKRVTILDFEALSLLSDFEASYLGISGRQRSCLAPHRQYPLNHPTQPKPAGRGDTAAPDMR